MKRTFDDKYLFKWMKKKNRFGRQRHISLGAFHSLPNYNFVVDSLSPKFLHQFIDYKKELDPEYINNLRKWIPPWYWQRLHLCAKTYINFFARMWPELAISVKDLIYLEWLLYVEPDYEKYRDHLLHMYKAACLGTWLLSHNDFLDQVVELQFGSEKQSNGNGPPHFRQWKDEHYRSPLIPPGKKEKKGIILWAFLLAALFHDLGYGYFYRTKFDQKMEQINGWLSALSQNTEPTCRSFETWRSSLAYQFIKENLAEENLTGIGDDNDENRKITVIDRRLTGFIRNTSTLNHGTPSCLYTLHLKQMLKDARAMNPYLDLAIEIAAEAVLLHDMTGKKNWCGINKNTLNADSFKSVPVAILLICCDELAIWERKRISPQKGNWSEKSIHLELEESEIKSIALELNKNSFKIDLFHGENRSGNQIENIKAIFGESNYNLNKGFRVFGGNFFGRKIKIK